MVGYKDKLKILYKRVLRGIKFWYVGVVEFINFVVIFGFILCELINVFIFKFIYSLVI